MVNTRYNNIRPVAPANAPVEEPAVRDRGQGRGRERAMGKCRGRVVRAVNEVLIDNVPVSENPPTVMKR